MLARPDCLSQSSELLLFTINTAFQNKSTALLSCLLDLWLHKTKLKHIFRYMDSRFLSAMMSRWLSNNLYWVWVRHIMIFQEKTHHICKLCLVIKTQKAMKKKQQMMLPEASQQLKFTPCFSSKTVLCVVVIRVLFISTISMSFFPHVSLCSNLHSLADGFITGTIKRGILTVSCGIKWVHCEATFDTSICGNKIHSFWTLCPETPYLGHDDYSLYAEHMEQ